MKPFEIIPAIDLLDGHAVRLVRGDYARATVYHENPIVVARHWAMRKAPRLHVVDLEGARAGEPRQLHLIASLCRAVDIPVQVGGGIRTEAHIQQVLEAGAERVILGTSAVQNPDFAREMFQRYGERLVLALDTYAGAVAVEGWQSLSPHDYLAFAQQMVEAGARRILYTNIASDGTLLGFEMEPLKALLTVVSVPVIASGGVRDERDLDALRTLAQQTSLEGVVVGKALYEGTLSDTIWEAF